MERTPLQHHPAGYPELQLAPRTTVFRHRVDANLHTLAKRLERWEAEHGNPHFQARNLHKLPTPLAFELVNVYVALRERYPEVIVDFINFSTTHDKNTLATATSYPVFYPALRSWSEYTGAVTVDDLAEDLAEPDDEDDRYMTALRQAARSELSSIARMHKDARPVNVFAVGGIEIGTVFASNRRYKELLLFWDRRNEVAKRRGLPPRVAKMAISAAAHTLVHEFGHLLDTLVCEAGDGSDAVVYGALSEALLHVDSPEVTQWRQHLLNYPVGYLSYAGPHQGGAVRQLATKQALRLTIREALGRYATVNRDELFAEAFALSFGSAQWSIRERLRPMRRALVDTGFAKSRVR